MKKLLLYFLFVLVVTASYLFPTISYCQPGTLDNTFGMGGKITENFGSSAGAYSVAIQTDGKIVVAGTSYDGSSSNDFALVRYNSDGVLDNSFDSDGRVTTSIGSSNDGGCSVAIQNDGKIVVAGYSYVDSNTYDFAIVRYNSNGNLDTSFSSDGIVTTDFGNSNDYATAATIQTDGKILVVGFSDITGNYNFASVRYNINGSLDSTFDADGKVTTDFTNYGDFGRTVTIQTDNKILIAGESYNGVDIDFSIVRYNIDGSLDSTFDIDGKVATDFGTSDDYAYSVTLQSNGKIVLGGYSNFGGNQNFALVRYNSDGSLDNTLDIDGKVTTDYLGYTNRIYSLALQIDDKIIAAGYSDDGSNFDFILARYNNDGSLDNSFDSDGIVSTDFGIDSEGYSLTLQSDSKIVVAGFASGYFAVARYNGGTIGIEESAYANSINVYPNPANNFVQIKSSNAITKIEILNINGSVEKIIYNTHQFSVADLTAGIYFVRIGFEKEGILAVKKIVVVR